MTYPLLGIDYATPGARADVLRAHPLYGAFHRWQRQHFRGRFDPNDDRDRMLFEAFAAGSAFVSQIPHHVAAGHYSGIPTIGPCATSPDLMKP